MGKILVVDDSAVMRRIVKGALGRIGVEAEEVVEATNGEEAVTAVGQNDVRLVLMDWNMPVKTGLEAVRDIRSAGNSMPIIMVTTESEKARVLEALKTGASSYIIKPFDPDTLAEKINQVLS